MKKFIFYFCFISLSFLVFSCTQSDVEHTIEQEKQRAVVNIPVTPIDETVVDSISSEIQDIEEVIDKMMNEL